MSSIDNRIVEMEFDNSQFEKGVATTMNSLSSLDNQLNGLSGNSFGSLAASVDQIADRFSNMGIVAMSIIENLTDRVVNFGINMAKSMTLDQITAGLQKYESITTSTIAIHNQAKLSYEDAAKYIEKLSWYSDATSFNLSNMVTALKDFSRYGIDLDQATSMIMGIGNSVTYAGQSAKEGSAAFAIFAKAMSLDSLNLLEWKRLSNLQVTSRELQQDFINAGEAIGTLKRGADGFLYTAGGLKVTLDTFDQTLSDQKGHWLNRAVMIEALGKKYGQFTSDLADATLEAQKNEKRVIPLSEAYERFANQMDEFGKKAFESAQKARTFTEAIDAVKDAASTQFLGVFQSIFGNPEEAMELWTNFQDWLLEVLVEPLNNLNNAFSFWNLLGGRDDLLESIKEFREAFSTILSPVKEFIDEIIPKLTGDKLVNFTHSLLSFAGGLRSTFTDPLEDFIKNSKEIIQLNDDLEFEEYKELFSTIASYEKEISFRDRVTATIKGIVDGLRALKDILIAVIQPFKQLIEPIKYFANGLLTIASNIGSYISNLTEGGKVTEWFKERLDPLEAVIKFVSDAIVWFTDKLVEFSSSKTIGNAIEGVGKLVDSFHPLQTLFEVGSTVFDKIAEGIKKIGKAISEHLTPIFGKGNSGSVISKAVLVLMALRKALETKGSFDFWKQMAKGVENFREIIENASDALESFVAGTRMKAFREMAVSIAIMAASLLVLASISYEDLAKGIAAIAVSIGMLQMEFKAINALKTNGRESLMNASSLVAISAAVLVLAESMKILAKLDTLKAIQGLVGISALLWELVGVLAVTQKFSKTSLTNLIALSDAVLILTASVAVLGYIKTDALIQGGIAIAAILVALLGFMGVLQNIDTKGFTVAMLGVVELSAALVVMSTAVIALGLIPWDNMVKGLVGIAALLAEIGIFAAVFKNMPGQFVALGAGMVLIAAAFAGLAVSLMAISSIGLDSMTVALVGLAGALTIIGTFTYLLAGLGPSMLVLGAALTVMSAGILVLSAAFAVLAAIGLPGIGTALLAVLGALIAFGTAGAIIGGAAVVGMLAFAAGLAAISAALIVLGEALIKIATACLIFKTAFGQTSTDVTNQFTQSSDEISKSAKNVEKDVTESAKDIENQVKESSNSVENDIDSTNNEVESSTNSMLGEIKNSWSVSSEDMIVSTTDLTDHLKEQFADAGLEIPASTDQLTSSVISDFMKMNSDSTGEVDGMSTDISKYFSDMGVDLASQTSGIGSNLSISWKDIGHNLMEGLKQGIRNKWNNLLETMASLGNQMQNTYQYTMGIYSPSRVFAKYGEYIDQGLINGIDSYSNRVMDTTENLGESVLNAFSDPMKQVASIANSDFTISPKITPVLDTTSIQNGKNYLESMFSGRSLSSSINGNINANLSAMSGISGDIGSLKNEIARMVAGQLNETVLSQALAAAMKNVDLYMDGAKVGKMITSYQSSVNRAGGI